jgi:hypothetical protein
MALTEAQHHIPACEMEKAAFISPQQALFHNRCWSFAAA